MASYASNLFRNASGFESDYSSLKAHLTKSFYSIWFIPSLSPWTVYLIYLGFIYTHSFASLSLSLSLSPHTAPQIPTTARMPTGLNCNFELHTSGSSVYWGRRDFRSCSVLGLETGTSTALHIITALYMGQFHLLAAFECNDLLDNSSSYVSNMDCSPSACSSYLPSLQTLLLRILHPKFMH